MPEPTVARTLPLPPAGFDPTRAPDADLERYGLPPRPDPTINPFASAKWQRAFRGYDKYDHIVPEFRPSDVRHGPVRRIHPGSQAHANATSYNWSGSVIFLGQNDVFSWISGSWTVPTARAVPGIADPNASVSVWLGIDGDHGSNGLLQAGTDSRIAHCAEEAAGCPPPQYDHAQV